MMAEIRYNIINRSHGGDSEVEIILVRHGYSTASDDSLTARIPDVEVARFDDPLEADLFGAYLQDLRQKAGIR